MCLYVLINNAPHITLEVYYIIEAFSAYCTMNNEFPYINCENWKVKAFVVELLVYFFQYQNVFINITIFLPL